MPGEPAFQSRPDVFGNVFVGDFLNGFGKEGQHQLSTLNISAQNLGEFLRATTAESSRQAKDTIQLFRDGAVA